MAVRKDDSKYTVHEQGMVDFLNSQMMLDAMTTIAEDIKGEAMARAPVGSVADGDEHPGLYMSSFHVYARRLGGAKSDRAEAIVYNDSPDALWVEFGHHGREPYHVLRRAMLTVSIRR